MQVEPVFVGFLQTLVLSVVPFFEMFIPRIGRVLSVAVSKVRFNEGCLEFKTSRDEVATWRPGMLASISSTYLLTNVVARHFPVFF